MREDLPVAGTCCMNQKNEPPHCIKPAPSNAVCEAGFVQRTARFRVES